MVDEGPNGPTFSPIWMKDQVRRLRRRLECRQYWDKAACRHILRHLVRPRSNEPMPPQGRVDRGSRVVEAEPRGHLD